MTEPRWLSLVHILAIHTDQIQAHGGSLGIRDRGLSESALERPRNRFQYDPDADLAALTAAYGFGVSGNHPFVDGNKRVAFQAMYLFLGLNGFRIDAPEEEVVSLILALASGELDEPLLADWVRQHISPRDSSARGTKTS
ncbi:MAG TPA: type II toxin-antitoxin system death-on-curing family toxin [Longimicrobiales bacterium]|nr:type II toxin-antitoxin system death-on-curing family toxin [Longimicrobiales bacterium]